MGERFADRLDIREDLFGIFFDIVERDFDEALVIEVWTTSFRLRRAA